MFLEFLRIRNLTVVAVDEHLCPVDLGNEVARFLALDTDRLQEELTQLSALGLNGGSDATV